MRLGTIYKITCIKNEKFLYGSSINFERRKKKYFEDLKNGKYSNKILQRCYNKYGWESLKFEIILENIPENILRYVESIWIGAKCSKVDDKKLGMNFRDGDMKNFSQESKDKMSKWQIGRKLTTSHIDNIKKNHCSKKPDWISPLKGKVASELSKQRTSEVMSKAVAQYSKSGKLIKVYKSQTQASKEIGIDKGHCNISKCCSGVAKLAYGYIWKYVEDINKVPCSIDTKSKAYMEIDMFIDDVFFKRYKNIKSVQKEFKIGWNTISNAIKYNKGIYKNYKFQYED